MNEETINQKNIDPNSYMLIRNWMIRDLKLDGVELLVYAFVFSYGSTGFYGSTEYMYMWLGIDRRTAQRNLKKLCDKELIKKHRVKKLGKTYCIYRRQKVPTKAAESTFRGGVLPQKSGAVPPNITNNKKENTVEDKLSCPQQPFPSFYQEGYNHEIQQIVSYLNSKANTNYIPSMELTRKLITARLNEGFTVDDFKKVIDKKCLQWQGGEFARFLRPSTLFGTAFESYLNAPVPTSQQPKSNLDRWDLLAQGQ